MDQRKIFRYIVLFAIVFVLFITLKAFAQQRNIRAKIFPKSGQTMLISDFNLDGRDFWYARWRGSQVRIFFKDIDIIKFTKPGERQPYHVDVSFNDGRKDNFLLSNQGNLKGKSIFGDWSMTPSGVVEIQFNPTTGPRIQPGTPSKKIDQVLLKNGDTISGQIKTVIFKLRASYGTLSFKRQEIDYIDFEGGGQNLDVIGLRVGDKLSGVVEVPLIKLLMISGSEIDLDKEKIKKVTFKK